ncbi:D-2-hydroxyacid dehydrogenase [Pseudonocardia nigra]|uniref:D-2-hydroxyacid dehydrogenase n=1 Tax=Pseudonocardia nigra TaxID=1921578 RepID=UPI001C5D9CCE|nr:D-2-hydroxyacid dehydrogenase [Pseudonocardia nigra]
MTAERPLILVGGDMGRGDGVDYRAELAAAFPQADFVSYEGAPDTLEAHIADADAVIGHVPDRLLPRAVRLRWVQTTGAGADAVSTTAYQEREDVVATTVSGVHVASVPEQVLAMMLAFARCLPEQIVNQRGAKKFYWPTPPFEVEGQTMAVLGMGRIGTALARKARGLGMRAVGWRRRETTDADDLFDHRYAPGDLSAALGDADHVVVTLPLTQDTRHLIGAAELTAMKPTAYLYNVGRGPIVDQDALLAALRAGTIAGAGLDVSDPEPLPSEHPLWDEPNVILLTHYGGLTPKYGSRAYAIIHDNVDRFLSGRPLVNVVEKQWGY